MALCQLLDKSCSSSAEVFCALRDFLTGPDGPGWVVVDSLYRSGTHDAPAVGDLCVLKSDGEAGDFPLYLLLTFRSATYLGFSSFLFFSWTVQPVGPDPPYHNIICPSTPPPLLVSIHADLDEVHYIVRREGDTDCKWAAFGRIKPDHLLYDGTVARYSGAISAGNDTVIRLLSWPPWVAVGKKAYCWDDTGLDELAITAVDPVNRSITAATTRSRSEGGYLAEDLCVIAAGGADWIPDNNRVVYAAPSHAATGADAAAQVPLAAPFFLAQQTAEPKYGGRLSADMYLCGVDDGQIRGSLALARHSNIAPATQGELWVDPDGAVWRAYQLTGSQRSILLRGMP